MMDGDESCLIEKVSNRFALMLTSRIVMRPSGALIKAFSFLNLFFKHTAGHKLRLTRLPINHFKVVFAEL